MLRITGYSDKYQAFPGEKIQFYVNSEKKENYYFYIGRCIPYKKFDLLVEAFNKNGKTLVIATNTDNALYRDLKKKSRDNIIWKFDATREEIQTYFSQAKAFLFPPEEDFWLVPLEAMACGTPVIAYGKWGALETVLENKTGIFFPSQTSNSLNKAIENFEKIQFTTQEIREHDETFDKKILTIGTLKTANK